MTTDYTNSPNSNVCGTCGGTMKPDTIQHVAKMKYEGSMHEVSVPNLAVLRCVNCKAIELTPESRAQLYGALRKNLGLLDPKEILCNRKSAGLTQKSLADSLSIAPETISRWETGSMVQSRAYDRSLRKFFKELQQARSRLAATKHLQHISIPNTPAIWNAWISVAQPVQSLAEHAALSPADSGYTTPDDQRPLAA